MYQNNVLCDLFIGKGAGRKMVSEIQEAEHSVRIISPYLSASLVYKLIELHRAGVDVQLVTTDAIMENSERYANTYKQLISEEKVYDTKAKNLRFILSIFTKIIWASFAISILLLYLFKDEKDFLYYIIAMMSLLCLAVFLQIKLSKFKTFSYNYDTLFPIKFLIAPENASFPIKTFIHSKVYIIDEKIMYLGSMNFTAAGTSENYETRIRTQDIEAIEKMINEFDTLFGSTKLPERKLSVWGHQIYHPKASEEDN